MARPNNPRGPSTKAEIMARRARIIDYIDKGVTGETAAQKEGIDMRTLRKDIAVIREQHAEAYAKKAMDLFAKWEHKADQRTAQAWSTVLDPTAPHASKVSALRNMVFDDAQAMRRAQALGLFPRDPPKVEITTEVKQLNITGEIMALIKANPEILRSAAQRRVDEDDSSQD